jgi:hypothetical protein
MTLDHITFARAVLTWAAKEWRIHLREYHALLDDVIRCEREILTCKSKDAFVSYGMAQRVMAKKYFEKQRELRIYHCEICKQFHFCTRNPLMRKRRVAEREAYRMEGA